LPCAGETITVPTFATKIDQFHTIEAIQSREFFYSPLRAVIPSTMLFVAHEPIPISLDSRFPILIPVRPLIDRETQRIGHHYQFPTNPVVELRAASFGTLRLGSDSI
jgi:hypothetical protein